MKRPGVYNGVETDWLRWMRADGLIPTTGAELDSRLRAMEEEPLRLRANAR